jgi:serine/threonine protein kinase
MVNATKDDDKDNKGPITSSDQDNVEMNSADSLLGSHLQFQALYKMKTQFSSGSYGTVWTASPVAEPEKVYAVKVIDRSKLKKKDFDSVFREVQILRELQDLPNVIPFIDFLQEPNFVYVVQFYAKGGDLFRRLSERKVFTEKDARDIAVTLFETLELMHNKYNIVHRDLKPENLLLEDRGTMKIYFADFGFANHVPEKGLKTRCGTPAFVAPEIIRGSYYRQPVDMWSIGTILFMVLGGYPPFHIEGDKKNLQLLFRKIRAGDFTFHESQWKNVSPAAKSLIAKLLTVNPDHRFTAKQALESNWIKDMDSKSLSKRDLSQSMRCLKKFDSRLTLMGAMNAVKFAVSAGFWNPEAITFSRQTRKIVMDDSVVKDALWSPGRVKFDDEYEVKSKIRRGSCATVYECEHKGTKEIFAVKIIRRAKLRASEDEFVLNEVSIMQSLSQYGDYIVQLLDFYEEEEYFYLVMDYMGGGDVFDRVLEKEKYTEDDARKLTKVLLKATRCMHSTLVAHRDLKPQNLLLTVSLCTHPVIRICISVLTIVFIMVSLVHR